MPVRRRAVLPLVVGLTALAIPAGAAHAATSANVDAAASLQVRATTSTQSAVHLADADPHAALRKLDRTRVYMTKAHDAALRAIAAGDSAVAAMVSFSYAATAASNVEALTGLADRASGKLEQAAVAAVKDDVRLSADVTASASAHVTADGEADAAAALSSIDDAQVAVVSQVGAAIEHADLRTRSRRALEEAAGAAATVRNAMVARVQDLHGRANVVARRSVEDALATMARSTSRVSGVIRSLPRVSVTADAYVGADADVALPGAKLVAKAVATLRAGGSTPR
jgi:hypothetical protein